MKMFLMLSVDLPAILTLFIAVSAIAGLAGIVILSSRKQDKRDWHDERNDVAPAPKLPSFEVYSAKERQSRQLEAANRK